MCTFSVSTRALNCFYFIYIETNSYFFTLQIEKSLENQGFSIFDACNFYATVNAFYACLPSSSGCTMLLKLCIYVLHASVSSSPGFSPGI